MTRSNPEADLQRQVATYLSAVLKPEVVWSAIGHGSALGGTQRERMIRGGILKGMGLQRGVPDLVIMWLEPGHGRGLRNELPYPHTLWIELKSPKGKQSPEQLIFAGRVTSLTHQYYVCRSLNDVINALKFSYCPTREAKR